MTLLEVTSTVVRRTASMSARGLPYAVTG